MSENILLLETATSVCSVALAKDGQIVAQRESGEPNAHSSRMAVFVEVVMKEAGMEMKSLTAVAVSSGPGSYTGLRIGVSGAKGICYGLEIPLVAVPTLASMAAGCYARHKDYEGLVAPMIDARRMECYNAIYDKNISKIKDITADIIEEHIYDQYLDRGEVVFIGDGAAKTREVLGVHPNARFDENYRISAADMLPLAIQKLQDGETEDVAYFEPYYLKDFVAKKSVVRGLH